MSTECGVQLDLALSIICAFLDTDKDIFCSTYRDAVLIIMHLICNGVDIVWLNFFKVFDLGEKTPDKVLHQLYYNLEKLKQSEDSLAFEIENKLRIIVS